MRCLLGETAENSERDTAKAIQYYTVFNLMTIDKMLFSIPHVYENVSIFLRRTFLLSVTVEIAS